MMAEQLRCSFCNKAANEIRKMIAGPNVFICDECVKTCVDIIASDPTLQTSPPDEAQIERLRAIASAQDPVACSLCGKPARREEVLPIDPRGVLCGACAGAVEDALRRGEPL